MYGSMVFGTGHVPMEPPMLHLLKANNAIDTGRSRVLRGRLGPDMVH